MVAKVKTGKSIAGALRYNEVKVNEGKAELLFASNFSCDVSELTIRGKLNRFEKLTNLNPKVSTNTMHVVLSFAPDEEISEENLMSIANNYMKRIGFGDQPYLVYKHHDTANSHLHVVTTNVKASGRYISMHNIGRRKSEPARKAIEIEYDLVKAEERKKIYSLSVANNGEIPIAEYGVSETKKRITDIVSQVTASFRFCSIEELNAILRQYNIQAFVRNCKSGKQGLVYSIVDRNGHKTGIPIKASAIYANPTLASLTEKFERNKSKKQLCLPSVHKRIAFALRRSNNSQHLTAALHKMKLACSIYYRSDGTIDKVYFTDHQTRSVFSANELGLTPSMITNRFDQKDASIRQTSKKEENPLLLILGYVLSALNHKLLEQLLRPEYTGPDLAPELLRKKRKRRR
jgi:hypothetical protein